MRYATRLSSLFVFFFLSIFVASAVRAQTWTKKLARDVTLTQIVQPVSNPNGKTIPRVINVVRVDPKSTGIRIQAVLGGGDRIWGEDAAKGRETAASIAKRLNAVALINGDYFNWDGDPLGLHISGGELISEPYPGRTIFGITSEGKCLFDRLEFDARVALPDGKWFPIRGINRPRGQNELVAYTSRFYSKTCTSPNGSEMVIATADLPIRLGVPTRGTVIGCRPDQGDAPIPDGAIVLSGSGRGSDFLKTQLSEGMSVTLEFNVKPSGTGGWESVVEAIGGAPRLIRNSKISVEADEEGIKPEFYNGTHPRTAIGVTADGKVILVTVDGHQSFSMGITLKELAEFMRSQGCVDALNLDGGGSTTIATSFGVLNSPSGGSLRALSNGLAVLADSIPQDCPEFVVSPPPGCVASGAAVQLSLLDASTGDPLEADLASRAVWSTAAGMGFVNQSGRFYGYRAGRAEVVVRLGSRMASVPVEVTPGPASKLTAKLQNDPTGAPNRSVVSVTVTDLNGNGMVGRAVYVAVIAGAPDQPCLVTDGSGNASTGITWSDELGKPAGATVISDGLPKVVIQRPK